MTRFRLSMTTALLTCQAFLTGPLLAQEAGTIYLEEITLEGRADPAGPVRSADPETLTGSKTAALVTEIPQSVSVISAQDLKTANANKLDGALAFSAGVLGQPYGYDSDTNWIFIRGFAATATGSYQDGLPNFAYGFGGFYVDPFMVERIEVLKGPSSALYGGSNPGGLVNYASKTPTGEPGTDLEVGADEHGRVWASADHQGRFSDVTDYRILGKLERVDGNGAFDAGFHGVGSGSMRRELSGGGSLTLGLDLMKIDETHVGSSWLPYEGTVVAAPFGFISREFNTGEPKHDRYERDQIAARLVWNRPIGDWEFTNTARAAWSKVEEDSVYAYGYSGFSTTPQDAVGTMSRLVFDHSTEAKTLLNDARLERELDVAGTNHRLMLGVDVKYFAMDQVQSSAVGTPLSFANPVYGAAQPAASPYIDQKMSQTQVGFYVQDQIRFGDGWIGTGNLRYDRVKTDVGTNYAAWGGPAPGYDRTDGEFSWRVGLAKELPGGLTAYASASTYFNPEIKADATGTEFPPETGRQFEGGLKWAPNDDLLVTLSAYDLKREDITQSVTAGTYNQLGEVRSRGIELEAQGKLGHGLALRGALTLMDVEIRDDANAALIGKTPYSIPEKTASLQVSWTPEPMPDLTLTGAVRWVGDSWADNENTLKVKGRTLLDLGATYRFGEDWEANLAVENVTDEDYVASCQTAYWCYYGAGRTASLSLRKSF
ncbi:TonB-dependent siderophore receptor [Neomegalonema perideroedes]|uniref:TonB-dependent siderophore receptor n=1 Tax=Neomegalonema perideroedes TaxID=217219 RepID=UPI000366501A|nr:TonB-dependent siderophore receptor [Neomegalonema perideroedes]